MDTFFVRTKPASSMANPAAIHMTRKPPIKKRSVLKTKASFAAKLSNVGASCAKANAGAHTAITAAPLRIFAKFRMVYPFQMCSWGGPADVMRRGRVTLRAWVEAVVRRAFSVRLLVRYALWMCRSRKRESHAAR